MANRHMKIAMRLDSLGMVALGCRRGKAGGNQGGGVGQSNERTERARGGEIAGLPNRIELALECTQSLEIVKPVAVLPNLGAEPMPARAERLGAQPAERRDSETENVEILLLERHEQSREQELHRVSRGFARASHHADRSLRLFARRHHAREGDQLSIRANQAEPLRRQKARLERGDGEPLLVARPRFQPLARNRLDLFPASRGSVRTDILEREALALAAPQGITQMRGGAASQGESPERDTGVLAQLHHAEPSVEVERQTLRTNLVEGGATAMRVGLFDEARDQRGPFAGRADGVQQSDPTASSLAEHQKCEPGR